MSAPSPGSPRRISPAFMQRIWGVPSLSPYFTLPETAKPGEKFGEVWFQASPEFPILIKFLFTSERLSVQVHPKDEYAARHENSRGKTEMWHILAAEPGASVAVGFREPATDTQVRQAIQEGTLESLLNWVPVKAGDTLFAEAGVVHAIGAGIVLCEIQQNSDVTYRLYDYGRPRELHLEKGLAVASFEPYEGFREYPVTCEHFHTEMLVSQTALPSQTSGDHLLIVLEGSGEIAGERFEPGEVWMVPEAGGPVEVAPEGEMRILRASAPVPAQAT